MNDITRFLTNRELERLTGLSRKTIYNYRRGEYPKKFKHLEKLFFKSLEKGMSIEEAISEPNICAADLPHWIEGLGGVGRVSRVLGYDQSNLWRYRNEELEMPVILKQVIKFSKYLDNLATWQE